MEENTIENPLENYKYAGFGVRLSAFIIDSAIYMLIAYLIWGNQVVNTSDGGIYIGLKNWQMIVPLLYFFLNWLILSSSIGKLIFGLKMINEEGNRINIKEIGMRLLMYLFIIIGVWFLFTNKKKQALHDIAAKTFVVFKKKELKPQEKE
jgi:uncharacterized RDD family membrane protein YckC